MLDKTVLESRIKEIDKLLYYLPISFAFRWCEPGPLGCACLGCANGSEVGAGNLARLGYTKEEWEAWKLWKR